MRLKLPNILSDILIILMINKTFTDLKKQKNKKIKNEDRINIINIKTNSSKSLNIPTKKKYK